MKILNYRKEHLWGYLFIYLLKLFNWNLGSLSEDFLYESMDLFLGLNSIKKDLSI